MSNGTFLATWFNQYLGKRNSQACESVRELSIAFVDEAQPICGSAIPLGWINNSTYYGKALVALHKNDRDSAMVWCNFQDMYISALNYGASALLWVSSVDDYGKFQNMYFPTFSQQLNNSIPFLHIETNAYALLSDGTHETSVQSVELVCSEKGAYESALMVRFVFLFLSGLYCLRLGVLALSFCFRKIKRQYSAGVRMRFQLLLLEGVVLVVIGVVKVIGCQGYNSNTLFSGSVLSNSIVGTIFLTGFSAFTCWTTILLTAFWFEVSIAALNLRPVRNVFILRRLPFFCLGVLLVGTEQAVLLLKYVYFFHIPSAVVQAPILMLNSFVAVWLWRRTSRFLILLAAKGSVPNYEQVRNQKSTQLASFIAFGIRKYCALVLLQFLTVPLVVILQSPIAVECAIAFTSICRLGLSATKVHCLLFHANEHSGDRRKTVPAVTARASVSDRVRSLVQSRPNSSNPIDPYKKPLEDSMFWSEPGVNDAEEQ